MTITRITLKACLTALIALLLASMAQAVTVIDNDFIFREFRINPPLNYNRRGDLMILGVDVTDTLTGVAPEDALVGAENLITNDKFFLRSDGPVQFSLGVPYTLDTALGTWVIGVTDNVGTTTSLIGMFGTGPGTGQIPGVSNLAIVPGAQPTFSWDLPAGLPFGAPPLLNDGNIDRIRTRIHDSNGLRILNDTVDEIRPLDATSYPVGPGVITHNGAFVGQVLIEGLIPFNRSRTFETFVVDNVNTGGGVPVALNPFFYRSNTQANSVRFGEGDSLTVDVFVSDFVNTFVYAQNGSEIVPLSQAREANRQFEFFGGFAHDPTLTGPWTVTAWNGNVESFDTTNAVGTVASLPFVNGIRMLPDFLTPTIEWDLPPSGTATFQNVQIGLFDDVTDDRLSVFGPMQDQLLKTLSANETRFTFQPGQLGPGKKYVIRIVLRAQIPGGTLVNRSLAFVNFSPIMMTSSTPVFLPSLSAGGVYNFDFDVSAGFPVTIDPHVAIGYEYAIGPGDPRFATVTLPFVGDNVYVLILFDDMDNPLPAIPVLADVPFDFTTEVGSLGVDKFIVLGIEESASLDPNDTTAFMTTLTFTGNGQFTGTMTPISEADPTTVVDLVDSLSRSVQALVESGKLKKKEGEKLSRRLDQVLKEFDRDRTRKVCRNLDKFVKEVSKLIKKGMLDAEDGDPLPLIEHAEAIKSVVDCDVDNDDDDDSDSDSDSDSDDDTDD